MSSGAFTLNGLLTLGTFLLMKHFFNTPLLMKKYLLSLVGLALLSGAASAQTTYYVTNTNDSGPGSMREAFLATRSNLGDRVEFQLGMGSVITLKSQILITATQWVPSSSYDMFYINPEPIIISGGSERPHISVPLGELVRWDV